MRTNQPSRRATFAGAWVGALCAGAWLFAFAACSSNGDAGDSTSPTEGASTAFIPGSAAPMPPLPPGAGPHGPNPNLDASPMPVQDSSAPKDAATGETGPTDAGGQ